MSAGGIEQSSSARSSRASRSFPPLLPPLGAWDTTRANDAQSVSRLGCSGELWGEPYSCEPAIKTQHPAEEGRYVMYGDIYCTEIYISYLYTFLT